MVSPRPGQGKQRRIGGQPIGPSIPDNDLEEDFAFLHLVGLNTVAPKRRRVRILDCLTQSRNFYELLLLSLFDARFPVARNEIENMQEFLKSLFRNRIKRGLHLAERPRNDEAITN